jgi:hypothetical protein
MVNSEELIGTAEYLTLYMKCRVNRIQVYITIFVGVFFFISCVQSCGFIIFRHPHTKICALLGVLHSVEW